MTYDRSTPPPLAGLDPVLLDTYLTGQCTPAELRQIDAWASGDPERRAALTGVRHGLGVPIDYPVFASAPELAARVLGAVTPAQPNQADPHRRRPITPLAQGSRTGRSQGHTLPKRVALFAGAATVAATVLTLLGGRSGKPSPIETRVYTTVTGQQAAITLINGATARLGPATKLSISTNPADASTTVSVVGQALFTLPHNDHAPFIVRTGNAVTRVLGTTFMVRKYESDHLARVVVTEGRVSLQGMRGSNVTGPSTVLSARTVGVVDDSGQVHVTSGVAVDDYTAWASGQLVFHKTPVRDIVVELGRAYGAEIQLADSSLAKRALTWTVPVAEKSLAGALDALTAALDAHVARSGSVILIVPGAQTLRRPAGLSTPYTTEREYGR